MRFPQGSRNVLVALTAVIVCFATPSLALAGGFGDAYHSDFNAILKANVDSGRVNYPGIAADPRFAAYVDALANADIPESTPFEQRLAFWVNAYNALAIQGILDGGSPSSLLGRLSYFKRDKYQVAGRTITLFDLEHDVIIPLGDNRIHFAIVCASASCPVLLDEAYLPSQIDTQLDEQARLFINDGSKNAYDLERGRARISKIFDWFKKDFAAESGSVQRYIAPYVSDPEIAAALAENRFRVKHQKYDWSLNGVQPET